MKPLFLSAVCMAIAASPVLGGLTPETLDISEMTNGMTRSASYAPNDPDHVYDMMSLTYGGPEDSAFALTMQNPASGAFCNLVHLRPGATSISSIHIVIDQRPATAPWTFSIAFRNDNGAGPLPVGSFLSTQSMGLNAWYVFGGMPFGGATATLFQFSLGASSANVTQGNIWVCIQGNQPLRVRTGQVSGNESHGNPGDGTPTSLYIGSGSGVYASSFGVGIGSASLMSSFIFASAEGRIGNWHMALGGAPEPATAALLGLVGLAALRRRRWA